MNNIETHPFYAFCSNRLITDETRDEFIMWFRDYLNRYFIINSDFLYGEIAKAFPAEDVQYYWNIFVQEKNDKHE